AFLSRGVEAYLGHYFFVDDSMAADFSDRFYSSLLRERNVGRAVQDARRAAVQRFSIDGDLTGLGAVFFGDAGTAERRDLATAS
ncbi:MAG: CHAT domain-containing protein, partial [Ilumatobacteraceae bacterium]